jgi:ribose transport system substrate-binding protein
MRWRSSSRSTVRNQECSSQLRAPRSHSRIEQGKNSAFPRGDPGGTIPLQHAQGVPTSRDALASCARSRSGEANMKALVRSALLMAIILSLSLLLGCSRHENSERYILVTVNSKLPYWQTARAGLEKAAVQLGVKSDVRGPDNYDPAAEVQEFRNAVAIKPAGILVSVADAAQMKPAIDEAVNAGIPVITVDSDAPDSKRVYFIGTNNLQAGQIGGQRVVDKLHGKGNVVFYTMPQTNLDQRLKGYKDVFADHPGIKIVEAFNIKGDSGNAFDRTMHYLSDKSAERVDAFICLEASAGKDVAEAVKRQNATDRLIIAMDVDEATLDLIKSGIIDATIAQKPYTMAYYGLKCLDDIHHYPIDLKKDYSWDSFSPVPAFVDTGVSLVDKINVDVYMKARSEAQAK